MNKHVKATAKGLAALGRGEDKMLVHMTPHEVAGLQRLALATGGSLTINPVTGLPEAGWLSSILPMVLGGFATVASGGTLGPLALAMLQAGSGAVGGALGAKAEGGDMLSGALGGALGGVGGGGIASSLSKVGTAAGNASLAATNAAGAAPGAAAAAPAAPTAVLANGAPIPGAAATAAPTATTSAAKVASTELGATPEITARYLPETSGRMMNKGLTALANAPGKTAAQVWKGMNGPEKLGVGSSGMGMLTAAMTPQSGYYGKLDNPMYYNTDAEYDPNGFVSFTPGTWTKKYQYNNDYQKKAAEGGSVADLKPSPTTLSAPPPPPAVPPAAPVDMYTYYSQMMQPPPPSAPMDASAQDAYMARLNALVHKPPVMPEQPFQQKYDDTSATTATTTKKKKRNGGKSGYPSVKKKDTTLDPANFQYRFDPNTRMFTKLAKGGGISDLMGGGVPMLPSRYVDGPGDGTSDDIPAEIYGGGGPVKKAALAKNEFVIDARTVSELGNGSSEAGAKALYEMVDRIQKSRGKVGQQINPRKRLLA